MTSLLFREHDTSLHRKNQVCQFQKNQLCVSKESRLHRKNQVVANCCELSLHGKISAGGNSHMKGAGMLVGNFELYP